MQGNYELFNSRKFLKPYLIAEVGVNYECDINLAKLMIDQASIPSIMCKIPSI